MKRFLPSGLMIFAGVLGIAAASAHADTDVTKVRRKFDLREAILRRFLKENHCPVESYAGIFVSEADEHDLDWRLLPSLSVIETGGGRNARGNNVFGWANGKANFESISEAVHHVAATLAIGHAYRGKNLEAKLFTYNHRIDYRSSVTDMMKKIYPSIQVGSSD